MSIHENLQKIKTTISTSLKGEKGKQIALILIIVLTSTLSFGLGRLSISENNNKVSIIMPNGLILGTATNSTLNGQNTPYNEGQSDLKSHEFINQASVEAKPQNASGGSASGSQPPDGALFTASKRGKKYYPIYCKAGESLSPANKIYFMTEDEAISKGYTNSSSCK